MLTCSPINSPTHLSTTHLSTHRPTYRLPTYQLPDPAINCSNAHLLPYQRTPQVEAAEKAHDSLSNIFAKTVAAAEKQLLARGAPKLQVVDVPVVHADIFTVGPGG